MAPPRAPCSSGRRPLVPQRASLADSEEALAVGQHAAENRHAGEPVPGPTADAERLEENCPHGRHDHPDARPQREPHRGHSNPAAPYNTRAMEAPMSPAPLTVYAKSDPCPSRVRV